MYGFTWILNGFSWMASIKHLVWKFGGGLFRWLYDRFVYLAFVLVWQFVSFSNGIEKLHLLNFNGTTPTLSPRFVISRNIVDWWNHDPPLFFPLVSVHFLKLVQILPITMYSDWIYLPFEFGINWSGYAAKVRLANNKLPGLNGFHYSPERRALVSLVIYRYIGHHAVTQPQTTAVCVCVGY